MEIDLNKLKADVDNAIDDAFAKFWGNVAESAEEEVREQFRQMFWEYELKDIYNK